MKKSANLSWRGTLQVLTLCGLSAVAVLGAQGQISYLDPSAAYCIAHES